MRKSKNGFSLIELLIVLTIILIIATLAVPNILDSRKKANETAAISELKTLHTAQVVYTSGHGAFGTIPDLIAKKVLDPRFAGTLSGYKFSISVAENNRDYIAEAVPSSGVNGRYAYYINSDGIIHYSTDISLAPTGMAGLPLP
jgi:prepilin-type N-terminal cleavage/methylation domain-containing protein